MTSRPLILIAIFISTLLIVFIATNIYFLVMNKDEVSLPKGEAKKIMITLPEGEEREIFVTDGVKHSVPLDEILSGGPPKDGIPPIDNPKFVSVEEAEGFFK